MTTETVPTEPTPPTIDPVAPPPVEPPAPVEPEAPVEPPAPPPEPTVTAETDKPHGNKGRKPWYLDRISEESEARRQAEARAQELQQMLERAQKTPTDPATTTRTTDNDAVETRARQIAQETLNGEKIRGVIQAGLGKFTDWDERAATLGAAGAATPDFVLDVVSVDPANAHIILHQLADDPQKAARLAKMDTRTRTIELVKMSMAATTAMPAAEPPKPVLPPKAVSKAPPPPPPVESGASKAIDWRSDKASDEEFSRGWEARQRERHAQGRR